MKGGESGDRDKEYDEPLITPTGPRALLGIRGGNGTKEVYPEEQIDDVKATLRRSSDDLIEEIQRPTIVSRSSHSAYSSPNQSPRYSATSSDDDEEIKGGVTHRALKELFGARVRGDDKDDIEVHSDLSGDDESSLGSDTSETEEDEREEKEWQEKYSPRLSTPEIPLPPTPKAAITPPGQEVPPSPKELIPKRVVRRVIPPTPAAPPNSPVPIARKEHAQKTKIKPRKPAVAATVRRRKKAVATKRLSAKQLNKKIKNVIVKLEKGIDQKSRSFGLLQDKNNIGHDNAALIYESIQTFIKVEKDIQKNLGLLLKYIKQADPELFKSGQKISKRIVSCLYKICKIQELVDMAVLGSFPSNPKDPPCTSQEQAFRKLYDDKDYDPAQNALAEILAYIFVNFSKNQEFEKDRAESVNKSKQQFCGSSLEKFRLRSFIVNNIFMQENGILVEGGQQKKDVQADKPLQQKSETGKTDPKTHVKMLKDKGRTPARRALPPQQSTFMARVKGDAPPTRSSSAHVARVRKRVSGKLPHKTKGREV